MLQFGKHSVNACTHLNAARASSISSLTEMQRFGLRVKVKREINWSFVNDRIKFKQDMKEKRAEHRDAYWDLQTQVENKYLDDFRRDRKKKMLDDLDRWRTAICKSAGYTRVNF